LSSKDWFIAGMLEAEDTWEDLPDLGTRFPASPAWGQARSKKTWEDYQGTLRGGYRAISTQHDSTHKYSLINELAQLNSLTKQALDLNSARLN
jgi:hypothetical protein